METELVILTVQLQPSVGGFECLFQFCLSVVQCGPPPHIDNGVVLDEKESYSYGAVAKYRCHGDLTLSGSRTLHCDKTGQFHPNPPMCIGESHHG